MSCSDMEVVKIAYTQGSQVIREVRKYITEYERELYSSKKAGDCGNYSIYGKKRWFR